ncbi:uncharacterized protein UMAG_00535 [Mycosarcoma maydis]|uniref:NYN domain-containing protein n=1 Tax=Mycosarcoma maydis TaxID=5270 RepID=A0A0D1D162_MYCMD|nr:uncharacterized protein UMAG_00535 [Ustilago maydis 521]KIS72113.1 hypothetical protein UMAG_00535 [Ustilago maydis 521]|eukprot:XP_011386373.1 hypothetical protein UMAG_00535 [Ustilago maydis 521]
MASTPQNAAGSASISTMAHYLQQPTLRWVMLAGLGAGSLLVATRFFPSLSAMGKDEITSDREDRQRELSPPSTAGNKAKRDRFKDDAEPIAIFWDVDNCAPPTGSSGRSVALAVRTAIQNFEIGPIVSFKAYLELSSETQAPNAAQVQLRSELQGCGVSLIDTPKSGRKDVADKMMITDLLAYAIDQPAPATVVLISGDRDFAYPLGILRNRGYNVVLVTPPIGAVPILEASANAVLSWRQDVLGIQTNKDGKQHSSYTNNASGLPPKPSATNTTDHQPPSTSDVSLSAGKSLGALKNKDQSPSERSLKLFDPLVRVLEQIKKEGNPKPLRSMVALRLIQQDKNVFSRAGAAKWAEYAAVAEAAGIVKLGSSGQSGFEWVTLNDNVQSAASSSPPTVPSTSSSSYSSAPIRQKPVSHGSTSSSSSNDPKLKPFLPLIEICNQHRSQSKSKPLCSYVGSQLAILARHGIVDAYALAGVPGWREYIAAAQKAGVARPALTDHGGVLAVELHPRLFHLHSNQFTAYFNRITDTATTSSPSVDKKMPTAKRTFVDSGSSKNTLKNEFTLTGASSGKGKALAILNGHEIPRIFLPLATLLLEQMAEGRSYLTDYFCHSTISTLNSLVAVPGLKVKTAEEFQEYVEAAVAAKIVTTEPGVKPNVRFVRLHPRLVRPGTKTSVTDGEDEDSDEAESYDQPRSKALVSSDNSKTIDQAGVVEGQLKPADLEAIRKEASRVLASLQRSTTSEGTTASGSVHADDASRFYPLIESFVALTSEGMTPVTKAKLSSEVAKRNPGFPGIGAFYQSLGCTGFTDYLQQAKEKGLVNITDSDGILLQPSNMLSGLPDHIITL